MYKIAYIDGIEAVHAKTYSDRGEALKAFNTIRRLRPFVPVRTESPDGVKYYGPKPATAWTWYEDTMIAVWKYYLGSNMEEYTGEEIFPCEFLDLVQIYKYAEGFGTEWVLVVHDPNYEPYNTCYIP